MKFNVNQQDLQKSLNYCQGVIEKRSTLPILSNVLLEVSNSKLTITATDLDLIFIHQIQNVEIIDLQTIRPLDKNLILESVKKTNRLITVEESWPFASVGSEIVSIVQNEAFDYLDSPIKKINSADVPMPYSSVLEKLYLPQVEDIVMAIEEVCYI